LKVHQEKAGGIEGAILKIYGESVKFDVIVI
jgi:hypothetical protein